MRRTRQEAHVQHRGAGPGVFGGHGDAAGSHDPVDRPSRLSGLDRTVLAMFAAGFAGWLVLLGLFVLAWVLPRGW